ncbi:hypothetical protein [Oligoflexus tunisiensis]|uniref:hypothetical protein n=1 Tax=Oligoflexus tunisiensis TaxID=708132 RepID=UPI00114CDA1B|nr:hypothetical protein [Oligoflexus tunisiensis]
MKGILHRSSFILMFLLVTLSCQRPTRSKTLGGSKPASRPAPLEWESIATPGRTEAWSELVQCLEQTNFLSSRPTRSWYSDSDFAGTLLSLDQNMSLRGEAHAVTVIGKDGLRSFPNPCRSPKFQPKLGRCQVRVSFQDSSRRQRYIHLDATGLLYEVRNAEVKKVIPADRIGARDYISYMTFGETPSEAPARAASEGEIKWLLDHMEGAFESDWTTHHHLRNLQSQKRLDSCLKAAKVYARKPLFRRVAKLRAESQHFASLRSAQTRAIRFTVSLQGSDQEAKATLRVNNPTETPFFLEPDPEYPCFLALACGTYKPRFKNPYRSCPLSFGDAVGVAPGKSLNLPLDQIYDVGVLERTNEAYKCPLVLGHFQPIRPQ